MAGDWLKIEASTPDKPEVFEIAQQLKLTPTDAFGRLFLVWRWFDQHTEAGNADNVTSAYLDHIVGVSGFSDAMLSVGWLKRGERDNYGLSLPNFDRHNGQTAKNRVLTARRVATHKKRLGNDQVTVGALPREEKRRSKKQDAPPDGGSSIWDFGKTLLAEQGLSKSSAGALIGSWLRDWSEPAVADALRAAAGKADARAYVQAVLNSKPKKSAGPVEKQVAMP